MTKSKIVFRLATRKDRLGICQVNEKSLPVGYDLNAWEAMIAHKRSFVVTRAGLVIGYIVADSEGCIVSFAVFEEYRKQGFGKKLLLLCLDNMKKLGHKKVILRVKVSNAAAQNLYISVGFKQKEILHDYYDKMGDGYLMQIDF